jgi:hypothetical protein
MTRKTRSLARATSIIAVCWLAFGRPDAAYAGMEYAGQITLSKDTICVGCPVEVTVSVSLNPICTSCDRGKCPETMPAFYSRLTISGTARFVKDDAECGKAETVDQTWNCLVCPDDFYWPPHPTVCPQCPDNICDATCQTFTIAPGETKTFWVVCDEGGPVVLSVAGHRPCGASGAPWGDDSFDDTADLMGVEIKRVYIEQAPTRGDPQAATVIRAEVAPEGYDGVVQYALLSSRDPCDTRRIVPLDDLRAMVISLPRPPDGACIPQPEPPTEPSVQYCTSEDGCTCETCEDEGGLETAACGAGGGTGGNAAVLHAPAAPAESAAASW